MNSAKCCAYYSIPNLHKSRSFEQCISQNNNSNFSPTYYTLTLLQQSVSISLYLNVVIILIKNANHVIGLNCHCIEFLHVDVFSDITSRSESVLRCSVISRRTKYFHCSEFSPPPPVLKRSMVKKDPAMEFSHNFHGNVTLNMEIAIWICMSLPPQCFGYREPNPSKQK